MAEFLNAPDSPADIEHKAVAVDPGAALLNVDEDSGVVEALVSVTGIPDEVKDIIEPGAYKDTLTKRIPKGIFAHDWNKWVAATDEIKELLPGDPMLPKTTPDGKPWPAAAGALYVKTQFNMDTQRGRDAFSDVRFFSKRGQCSWSIGYQVPAGGSVRTKDGYRKIRTLSLFEYSPVLFGAAPLSGTLSVKSAIGAAHATDDDLTPVQDWTTNSPDDDPITAEADEDDPDMQALHAAAITEMNEDPAHWDAIDAASAIDPGEEEITSTTADALQAADERRQGAKGLGTGLSVKDAGDGGTQADGSGITVSASPWSDFKPSDYTPQQWHKATLIHAHPSGLVPEDKQSCKLPVREPDGTVNRNAVAAAAGALAGARGGVDATPAQKKTAAARLRGLYKKIGDTPPSSLQAKVLTSADVTGTPPTGPSGPIQLRAREAAEFTGLPTDYTLSQWHDATLVHNHPDAQMPQDKTDCHLPVSTPDGALSIDGMHQAAATLASEDPLGGASDTQKQGARTALMMLFRRAAEPVPDMLAATQVKVAGQDVTPADAKATERLRQWYEHGGGAAQIGWGVGGDFDKCVAIAGRHMDPGKARGYCQLRHKGATGHYAGHAPGEEFAHGPASAAAGLAGKKGIIDPETLGATEAKAGYDPALETGEYAGHLAPETKSATLTRPAEERLDAVAAAVTEALGGTLPGPNGMPRRIVAVQGTWGDHAIATSFDAHGRPGDGESYRVPYSYADGTVTLGDPEPVTLTLSGDTGTKVLGDQGEELGALPVLVEYVAGFIRRGLGTEIKAGRVLSDSNAKLLQGAVDQLIMVLNAAGIQVGVEAGKEPDEQDEALNEQGSTPLYLPDSTAPAAQVNMQKVLIPPELMARAYRVTAAVHNGSGGGE
jgi:phage head maturation protease